MVQSGVEDSLFEKKRKKKKKPNEFYSNFNLTCWLSSVVNLSWRRMKRNLCNASLRKKERGRQGFKMFLLIIKYKVIGLGNCYLSSYKEISYACFLFHNLKHFVT